MKKIFGIALTWILFSTVTVAQVATTTAKESVNKVECSTPCVPTKECAEKHGMTLEECKKICASKSASTASTEEGVNKVASATKVSELSSKKKACCASKASAGSCSKAKTVGATEGSTKVAAAVMVNEVEEVSAEKTPAKKCCSSKAACTKKKG